MLPKILKYGVIFVFAFILGVLFTGLYAKLASGGVSIPKSVPAADEVMSPQDWIKEDDILVYKNKVVINIKDPEWASFSDTNSMDPILDAGSNAIEIVPTSPDQIEVGDIVSYESKFASGTIIHRVIQKGVDSNGVFFVMKGDNNPSPDPGRIRFDQVKRVLVAIIY